VSALAIGVAGAFFAALTGAHALVAALTLPALAALVLGGRRFALSVPAQVLMLIGCGLLITLLTAVVPFGRGLASEALRPIQAQLGATALLLAGLRLQLKEPVWGLAGTMGAGLLVFLAGGSVHSGRVYPALLLCYVILAFVALRIDGVERGERQARARLDGRHLAASLLLVGIAGGMSLSLALAMPRLYSAAYDWALRWVGDRALSGFHDGPLRLGALHGMLQSREVVLRVRGEAGDHLRGNVYTRYQHGRWLPAKSSGERSVQLLDVPEQGAELGGALAEIRFAQDDLDRFFLPVLKGGLQLSPSNVRVDEMGIARTEQDEYAEALRLLPGSRQAFALADPTSGDLALPAGIEAELRALVSDWTSAAGASTAPAAERVATLQARLESAYVYSLDFEDGSNGRDFDRDPVLHFLLEERAGHCEYFASAMTLLARAAGVPARMVTGYRVAERNPYGNYYIVREQHAHAWSELFLGDRGWVTVDPSPLRGSLLAEADRTPLIAGLVDYAQVLWQERGAEALLVVLVLGLAGVQVRRLLAARSAGDGLESPDVTGPPRHLEALLELLDEGGLGRAEGETLESLARRTHARGQHVAAPGVAPPAAGYVEAGDLLRRYAALRYGDIGDHEGIRRDIETWLARASRQGRQDLEALPE
jgi:hypothetical protein